MKRQMSLSDMCAGPVNKKSRIVSLPLPAQSLMADMKGDDFAAENACGSGPELSLARGNGYKQFHISMKNAGMMYDVLFQWLLGLWSSVIWNLTKVCIL